MEPVVSKEPKQFIKVVSYSTFQSSQSDLVDVQGTYRYYDLDGSDVVERENTTVSGRVTKSNIGRIPSLFQGQEHKKGKHYPTDTRLVTHKLK